MNLDEFLALAKARRSTRRFKPDAVPDEALQKILEAGRWAMSGANGQPWEFVVVRDAGIRKQVLDSWREPMNEAWFVEETRVPEIRHHHLREPLSEPSFSDAPVLIAIVGDRRTYQATVLGASFLINEGAADAIYIKNMANAAQNMHLAAAAAGLASEWISVNRLWGQTLKKVLNVPEILEIQTLAAVGYPAYTPNPSYRRPLEDIVHYDKYDRDKYRSGEDVVRYLASLRENTAAPYRQGAPEQS
ncbi:MAG: nitroreductase family protein [Dehalococcoidia bacterium]|nr:nitroreductase family protein [Dehalococcoidia bacterium]